MSERDTQFAGFAKLLFDELPDVPDGSDVDEWSTACEQVIARRAYDLVGHVLGTEKVQWRALEEIRMSDISDMTELPTEQGHERT